MSPTFAVLTPLVKVRLASAPVTVSVKVAAPLKYPVAEGAVAVITHVPTLVKVTTPDVTEQLADPALVTE